MTSEWVYPGKEKDPDDHLQEILNLTFDPEEGAPAWLEFKDERLDFDPRHDIDEVEDLRAHFPYMDQDPFRWRPVWDFVPRSVVGEEELEVYETGGSTGPAARSVFSNSTFEMMEDYWESSMDAKDVSTDPDGDLLYIGPTGPHAVGEMAPRIGNILGKDTVTHRIDLDTRWIKELKKDGRMEEMQRYMGSVMEDQVGPILKSQDIDMLFTTSRILEQMAESMDVDRMGLEGILHGGTPMSPDTYRFLSEEVYEDTPIIGVYGNALAGTAMEAPREEGFDVDYFPNSPHLLFEIHDDGELVDYGEEGEVVFHRLTPEMFIPNKPERDKAVRIPPREEYGIDWDGVRNVGEFENYDEEATVGVY